MGISACMSFGNGELNTVNRFIFTPCNFRLFPHLEFAQTHMCLKRDNLRHLTSPNQNSSGCNEGKRGENKKGQIFSIETPRNVAASL